MTDPFEGAVPPRRGDLPSRGAHHRSAYPAPPVGYRQVQVPPDAYQPPLPQAEPAPAFDHRRTPVGDRFASPPQPTPWQQALPGLRRSVGDALVEMSLRQATAAWTRRRRDPLGPHAVLLLFAEPPAGNPPVCELRFGCRNFFADDEPRLPHLLDQIRTVAGGHIQAGKDLRTVLLNWCQPMSSAAIYAGVGVVTLDTADGSWQEMQRRAGSDMDVPGAGFAVLGDGTHVLMARRAVNDLGDAALTVDRPVGDTSYLFRRRWHYRPHFMDDAEQDPALRDVWVCLTELHHQLRGTGHVR